MMDAKIFLEEARRMCEEYKDNCEDCPLSTYDAKGFCGLLPRSWEQGVEENV